MRYAILAVAAIVCACADAEAQQATSQVQSTLATETSGETAPAKPAHAANAQSSVMFGSRKCHGAIDVASDNFVGNFETKVGTYLGNVVVTQNDCKLRADKVVAEAVTGNNLNRLIATGNVVFDSSSGTATGDNGVYDMGPKTITLTGKKVLLVKGKNVMRGTLLVVDMNTGLAHFMARGMPGGRVHSSFIPKDNDTSGAAPKDTKPKAKDDGDN